MDQTMVDVTDIEDVEIGDSVLLYGKDEYGELPLYEVADIANTITYELLCRITMRIPRVYTKNGGIYKIVDYLKTK